MRQYSMEKTEKITKTKAIFATLLIHFGLLFGLMYVNSDKTQELIPRFVKEWMESDTAENTVVINKDKRP
ncbi:MAG: hypothetical protein AAGJ18_26150 [Bacteroidota bacterium]